MPKPVPELQNAIADARAIDKAEPTPLALIAAAIDKGIDPDKLGKLMDLQERYEKGIAVKAYNAAMQACQNEIGVIVCDSFNPQTKSKYPSVESMNRKLKPIYTKHGFALAFDEGEHIEGLCRTTCEVMHAGGHSKHYHLDLPLDGVGIKGNANMTAIHGRLSSDTYAQGRLLRKIFNLTIADDSTDKDGNAANAEPTDDQWSELNTLLEETGHLSSPDKMKKFLNWANVPKLSDMSAAFFPKAIDQLRRVKEKGVIK